MKLVSKENRLLQYLLLILAMIISFFLSICLGSVFVPLKAIFQALRSSLFAIPNADDFSYSIIVALRLPRVICVALSGAILSLCGGAMQGLLKNPLAEGSTLGVSAGASLGAVLAIAFNITLPTFPFAGRMVLAMIFAFFSLLIIMILTYRLDSSFSTNTIILIGVIYSMFISSIISFITTFAGSKVKELTFWTMGSFSASTYSHAGLLFFSLLLFGGIILSHCEELNAFAIGEANARHIGVAVKKVKIIILIFVSALIGVSVSISGTVGFVGLVTPHMVRMFVGPNHKHLLPMSMLAGASFLMLADLLSRTILSPRQLPIGVVTSFIGSLVFVYVFCKTRRA